MRLGTRIFISYLVIFVICFYSPIDWIAGNLRLRYLEGVEDPLVDQANILACLVGEDMASGTFSPEKYEAIFDDIYRRKLSVQIYSLTKTDVDVRLYITDTAGKVIFDFSRISHGPDMRIAGLHLIIHANPA